MTLDEAIKHCKEVAHEKRIESGECISVNDLENAEACYECGEDHKQLAEWLTELKTLRKNRWIPCIQRLPEPLQNVIVCTDINTVTVAWINGDHWTFADTGGGHTENWSFDAVKYWMYLPEPPKGEQK